MLRAYRYIETDHQKLHNNIMDFFDRIEFETGDFSNDFFNNDFYEQIVKHHPGILKKPLKLIYNEIKTWGQHDRSAFIKRIKESNDIAKVCSREIEPLSTENIPKRIADLVDLKKMFVDLYEQVLKGEYCSNTYGSLQSHFEKIRRNLNDFTKCPACGLENIKTWAECRNQYDHYLHKTKYVTSSVNFKNLVPICTECNSYDVKHDRDILVENGKRKIFYPYDETHRGINILAQITNDDGDIENLDFNFTYSTIDDRDEEIESWKTIFKIDSRYKARAKGAGLKWYKHFWVFKNKPKYRDLSEEEKVETYLDCQDEETTEVIQVPILNAFNNSIITKAEVEANHFAMLF